MVKILYLLYCCRICPYIPTSIIAFDPKETEHITRCLYTQTNAIIIQ